MTRNTRITRILGPGEFYYKESFGPGTVCRGAVLLECEWDGGVVESGALMGVVFRSGGQCEGLATVTRAAFEVRPRAQELGPLRALARGSNISPY